MRVFDHDSYFNWLYKISFGESREWYDVMLDLDEVAFHWDSTIKYDENRALDGLQLRRDFLFAEGMTRETRDIDARPVSFFEVYVGLGKKLAHLLDRDLQASMAYLMSIGPFQPYFDLGQVLEAAHRVMDRDYSYNGEGGLFPLQNPPRDQRLVELLYQLNLHVLDLELG